MFGKEFDDHAIGDNPGPLIERFEENMLLGRSVFFEEEEFERIVEFYEETNQAEKGIAAADMASGQYPFCGLFYLKKAQFLYDREENEEALELLDTAELYDGTDVEIQLLRADILVANGDVDRALTVLEHAKEICDPAELDEVYYLMSEVHEVREDFDAQFDTLLKTIELNPGYEEAFTHLWLVADAVDRHAECIGLCNEIIDENAYNPHAWYNLGQSYLSVGLYEKSAEAFEYTTLIDETHEPAFRGWGEALLRLNRLEDAVRVYQTALKGPYISADLYHRMGSIYTQLGQANRARYYLRRALSMEPHFSEAHYEIGQSYIAEERYDAAVRAFGKALQIEESNGDYLSSYAHASYAAGHIDEAIRAQQRTVAMAPEGIQEWLTLAKWMIAEGLADDAMALFDASENKLRSNGQIIWARVALLLNSGKRWEGLAEMHRAMVYAEGFSNILLDIAPDLRQDIEVMQLMLSENQ